VLARGVVAKNTESPPRAAAAAAAAASVAGNGDTSRHSRDAIVEEVRVVAFAAIVGAPPVVVAAVGPEPARLSALPLPPTSDWLRWWPLWPLPPRPVPAIAP